MSRADERRLNWMKQELARRQKEMMESIIAVDRLREKYDILVKQITENQ